MGNTNHPSTHGPTRLKVWGKFGCFTDPIQKVERWSCPVMTPSAARNILQSIFWEPEFQWRVQAIWVLHEIEYMDLMRNEIEQKASPRRILVAEDKRAQRHSHILCNPAYVIEADVHPYGRKDPRKYRAQFYRHARRGECKQQPYLGCSEFPAFFSLADGSEQPIALTLNLGQMHFDFRYNENGRGTPISFAAKLKQGVLSIPQDLYQVVNWPYRRLNQTRSRLVPSELYER